MLKSEAANLPSHLTGIDNCQICSLYFTGFSAEFGICFIFFLNQPENCCHAMARFLDLLANTKQTCLRKSDPALPRREPRAAALLGMLSSRRVV